MSNDHTTPEFWEANYRQGQRRWELGGATPVFRRLAESGEFAPGRMIIPGAGLGDDGRLFARHGFQVTAVSRKTIDLGAVNRGQAQVSELTVPGERRKHPPHPVEVANIDGISRRG